jgi:putative transposase
LLTVVHRTESANGSGADAGRSLLDEIVRDGARQMPAAALKAEVAAYIEQFADQLDDNGRRLVVRNGYHQPRDVLTAAGAVEVTAPRVNDKRIDPDSGERQRFSSAILPAWARKSLQMAEVLPLLYLHGLPSGDFGPALEQFLGSGAGLSATTITRLTAQWQDEAAAFGRRDLSGTDYVYPWVDGIHLKVRLEQTKLCLLVMIGVRADGRKELVALTDGFRESTESWAELLRDCRRRGMTAPVLAIGDGALGLWKAVREVFPATREQRCWFHKQANILAALPKSAHPAALAAIKDIYNAEDIDKAQVAVKVFEVDFGAERSGVDGGGGTSPRRLTRRRRRPERCCTYPPTGPGKSNGKPCGTTSSDTRPHNLAPPDQPTSLCPPRHPRPDPRNAKESWSSPADHACATTSTTGRPQPKPANDRSKSPPRIQIQAKNRAITPQRGRPSSLPIPSIRRSRRCKS